MDAALSRLTSGGTFQLITSTQFKSLHLRCYWSPLIPLELACCTSRKEASMLKVFFFSFYLHLKQHPCLGIGVVQQIKAI